MFWRILKIIFFLVLIFLGVFLIHKINQKKPETAVKNIEVFEDNKTILDKLTLEQKIGQFFIIGFEGKVLNDEIENLIKKTHPGGILLLERNIGSPEQLKGLINSLQKIALADTGLPLLVAVDQEGGLISRINWIEKTAQSNIKEIEEAFQIGLKRGEALKGLGININLSPLLDESFPGDFIFERSFKKEKDEIGELAKPLIEGQREAGILTAIKHFPGYGKISFNPEEKLAVFEKTSEISQFRKANISGPEMIMVSNAVYQNIDKKMPFSFSESAIQFLKEKIPGDYLIISDDLSQNSLLKNFSLKEIVALPIKAGVDILIFSGWRVPVFDGVMEFREAVENGEVSEERINQSLLKIIELKKKTNDGIWN